MNVFSPETAAAEVEYGKKGIRINSIHLGYVLTQVGFPGLAIYSASKAALKSLSQTLAAALAPQYIRVMPGAFGEPQDIAELSVFLACFAQECHRLAVVRA